MTVSVLMLLEQFRRARSGLLQWKAETFPPGVSVQVKCQRFTGVGIVVLNDGCPADELAVMIENGNTWRYPLEHCQIVISSAVIPAWVRDYQAARKKVDSGFD